MSRIKLHPNIRCLAGKAFLVLAVMFGAVPVASADSQLKLVQLGNYHGDEISVKSGETGLGLFIGKADAELIPGVVRIEIVDDPIIDQGDGKSGKRVSFAARDKVFETEADGGPIIILAGPGLTPGPLGAAKIASSELALPIHPGKVIPIESGFSLFATGKVSSAGGADLVEIVNYSLRFVDQRGLLKPSIELVKLEVVDSDAGCPRLLFSGDINRDGMPDLLLSASGHYNVSSIQLFLSSSDKTAPIL